MAERVFRIFSLAFLSIGFVIAVVGADRDGPQDFADATSELIQHVSEVKDANLVNAEPVEAYTQLTANTSYVSHSETSQKTKTPTLLDPVN